MRASPQFRNAAGRKGPPHLSPQPGPGRSPALCTSQQALPTLSSQFLQSKGVRSTFALHKGCQYPRSLEGSAFVNKADRSRAFLQGPLCAQP